MLEFQIFYLWGSKRGRRTRVLHWMERNPHILDQVLSLHTWSGWCKSPQWPHFRRFSSALPVSACLLFLSHCQHRTIKVVGRIFVYRLTCILIRSSAATVWHKSELNNKWRIVEQRHLTNFRRWGTVIKKQDRARQNCIRGAKLKKKKNWKFYPAV